MIGLIATWASLKRFAPLAAIAVVAMLVGLCSHFAQRAAANAQAMHDQARQFAQSQALAAQAAQAERDHLAASYEAKAMEAQNDYQAQMANSRSALDRYIATHRLQPQADAGGTGTAVATAQRDGTGVSEGVPPGAIMVSTADLQACTDSVSYAEKAHDWAVSLDRQNGD